MAVSSVLGLLLLSLVVATQVWGRRPPLDRRAKREAMASVVSFFSSAERRLAALEARLDNSTEERLARLEARVEGEVQQTLQAMHGKLQGVEDRLQGVEDGLLRLESKLAVLLSSELEKAEQRLAVEAEVRANNTEERLASLEAGQVHAQASPAACQFQYQFRYQQEAPGSSADLQRVAKLEAELSRLQEKMSALDSRLQDNELREGSLHNASVLALEGVVLSVTELVAASEQAVRATVRNATEALYRDSASLMNATQTRLLARADTHMAALQASIARVDQTSTELAARVSAVEDKVDSATSLRAEETRNIEMILRDLQGRTNVLLGGPQYRRSCQEYTDDGVIVSGVYTLQLGDGLGPMQVYCDISNSTGWTVFQRRQDGSVDFFRDWKNYEDGFGNLYGEFWLGNRNIHRLTSAGLTKLRVGLQAWNGSTAFASYSNFSVGDASSSYKMSVSGYSGTAGDSLGYNNGKKFTTKDRDNDDYKDLNCAQDRQGGWWYSNCANANPNGLYGTRDIVSDKYVTWHHWFENRQALQRTELKLK